MNQIVLFVKNLSFEDFENAIASPIKIDKIVVFPIHSQKTTNLMSTKWENQRFMEASHVSLNPVLKITYAVV